MVFIPCSSFFISFSILPAQLHFNHHYLLKPNSSLSIHLLRPYITIPSSTSPQPKQTPFTLFSLRPTAFDRSPFLLFTISKNNHRNTTCPPLPSISIAIICTTPPIATTLFPIFNRTPKPSHTAANACTTSIFRISPPLFFNHRRTARP